MERKMQSLHFFRRFARAFFNAFSRASTSTFGTLATTPSIAANRLIPAGGFGFSVAIVASLCVLLDPHETGIGPAAPGNLLRSPLAVHVFRESADVSFVGLNLTIPTL
jgi:hypothetical protein